MSRGIIILNPVSGRGRGRRSEQLLRDFSAASGGEWELWVTGGPGGAAQLATRAVTEGARAVVAAGGDGTLHETLNGLLRQEDQAHLPALGVLPLGTGNDFARCIGVGPGLETALAQLKIASCRRVDVGRFTLGNQSRYFLNICGCGFDAQVAERVNSSRHHPLWRHLRGTPAYLAAVVAQLRHFRANSLHLTVDGASWSGRAHMCSIANSTSYGGGMLIAPGALVDDGQLDVCLILEAGRWEFLSALPSVFKGEHVRHPRVVMLQGQHIDVHTDSPLPVLVDGEVVGTTPARFALDAISLQFLVPPGANGGFMSSKIS